MEPTLDELFLLEPITPAEPPRAARKLVDHSAALEAAQAAYEAGKQRHGAAMGLSVAPQESPGAELVAEVVGDHPIEATEDEPVDRLKAAEDDVYQRNLRIVNDAARFAEIPYDAEATEDEVPQEWVDELGLQGALVRMRTAIGAQRGAKTAPFGLGMAVKVVTGLAKARAVERTSESARLNIQVVVMPQAPQYPVLEVAGRDD
jgi:hypothetical protein